MMEIPATLLVCPYDVDTIAASAYGKPYALDTRKKARAYGKRVCFVLDPADARQKMTTGWERYDGPFDERFGWDNVGTVDYAGRLMAAWKDAPEEVKAAFLAEIASEEAPRADVPEPVAEEPVDPEVAREADREAAVAADVEAVREYFAGQHMAKTLVPIWHFEDVYGAAPHPLKKAEIVDGLARKVHTDLARAKDLVGRSRRAEPPVEEEE